MTSAVAALVLAAGGSTRFGKPKQLLRLDGRTLVERAVAAALDGGCARVVVVLGASAEAIRAELVGTPATFVTNSAWREGLGSSIRTGIGEIELDAALLLACDQPRLDAAIVRRVLAAHENCPHAIVACAYADTLGVPALFPRTYFPELARLSGAVGAKPLLHRHEQDVVKVDWPDGALDVDTPEQWPGA